MGRPRIEGWARPSIGAASPHGSGASIARLVKTGTRQGLSSRRWLSSRQQLRSRFCATGFARPTDGRPVFARPVFARPIAALPIAALPIAARPIAARPIDALPLTRSAPPGVPSMCVPFCASKLSQQTSEAEPVAGSGIRLAGISRSRPSRHGWRVARARSPPRCCEQRRRGRIVVFRSL